MAYTLQADRCQIVTVRGTIGGQRIINRFHYAYFGPIPSPDIDTSDVFLSNFRAAYRAHILSVSWDDYSILSYDLVEIASATLTPAPPHRYQTNLDNSKLDTLLGLAADKGSIASAGLVKIPTHEVMRVKFLPSTRAPKRFRSNYARASLGFPISALAASPEQWTAGIIASVQGGYTLMVTSPIFATGFPVGSGYFMCAWSPPYYVNVLNPLTAKPREACKQFASSFVEPFVGTQITRRFFPAGGFRGI